MEEDVTTEVMVVVAIEVDMDIMEEVATEVDGVATMVVMDGDVAGRLLIHTITIPITTIPDPFTITPSHTNEP